MGRKNRNRIKYSGDGQRAIVIPAMPDERPALTKSADELRKKMCGEIAFAALRRGQARRARILATINELADKIVIIDPKTGEKIRPLGKMTASDRPLLCSGAPVQT